MAKTFSWDNVIVIGRKKTPPKTPRKPLGPSWDAGRESGIEMAQKGALFIEKDQENKGVLV